MRARISLGEGIPHENASSRLWWPLPSPPLPVSVFLSQLLAALQDPPLSADQVTVSLDGFNILHNTTTELLRDGDLLQIDIADGARAAAQGKKRKQPSSSPQVPAAEQSKAKIIKGGSESLKLVEKKDEVTPEAAPERPLPSSEKRPSRSARRKAAKRKWRRLGFPTLPFMNKKPQKENIIESSPGNAAQATKAKSLEVEKDATSDSSTSSDSSSESESEEKTSKSSDTSSIDTSSDSSSASDSSTSEDSSDEEEVLVKSKEPASFRRVTEEDFAALRMFVGVPNVGQVVAYKLLEIGDDFTPQVSEVRMGKVTAVDAVVPATVTLEPYPDASRHPLAQQIAERQAYIEEGEEEVEFAPPSSYDEHGMLTTELSSFVDLRCYAEPGQTALQAAQAGIEGQKAAPQPIAREVEHLGPSSYSKLGPPRPASLDVASPTSWAFLAATLQKRRAELSTPTLAAPPKDTSKQDKSIEEVVHVPASASAPQSNGKPPSGAAAVTNSRGRKRGSLHSALGPMLRMLRSSQQLD